MHRVRLSHLGTLAAISLVVALASPAQADDEVAGGYSVAEWREKLGRSELATAAYAAGVMATSSHQEIGKALIGFLASPAASDVMKSKGFTQF